MEFFAITFKNTPTVRFAHLYESGRSDWEIFECGTLMEITAIEKGSLMMKASDSDEKNIFKEGNVFTTLHKNYIVETIGDFHRHVTIAMTPDKISGILTAKDVLEMSADINNDKNMIAIIPFLFSDADSATIALKIRKTVDIFHSSDVFRNIKSTAMLLDILSLATTRSVEIAQKEISGIRRYNHTLYCQQAMRYIAAHIREPINVEEIAESMNVSYGHLSRLFKKQTNFTLVDYINKEKVRKMEELLWTKKMSVSEVAQGVGISDEKYASRLFRRYTGLTISSYVKLYRK